MGAGGARRRGRATRAPSAPLRQELAWFAGGLLASGVLGVLIGPSWVPVLAFAVLYVLWLLRRKERLARWLEGGAKAADAPPTLGLGSRIVELIHREKKYSRKQKQRYRNALAQFNDLAVELPDAIVVLDSQRQIRWANAAARTLLGVQPERDRGQRIDNLVRAPDFRRLVDGRLGSEDLEIELPSGSGRTLVIRNIPSGKRMSVLIARDETQRIHLREMRKAFVGDVSHELRTPLTVIEGYLEMLGEREDLDDETTRAIAHVAAQSARMRHIVEHLLQLSRLEGNPLAEDEGETVAVAALLRSMVATALETTAAGARRRIELDVDDGLALLGSESEIWSACNNLLGNALKYGGEGCRIDVAWTLDARGCPVCSVGDDGPGIEARHLPRLSERFYRVDQGRSRVSGGTGLGLAIVKHAAQRHGGQLVIDSTPGIGSSFRIEFPAHRAVELRAAANG